MDHFIKSIFIDHSYSPEFLALLTFSFSSCIILLLMRLYGVTGLFCYVIMAYLATNIQVLYLAEYSFLTQPLALGTILFATTFLVSDIITEHYGSTQARKVIGLSFITQIAFTGLMILTLAHPIGDNIAVSRAIEVIFLPAPRLLFASLISFAISQLLDIWLFQRISKQTNKKHLWFRTFFSTSISALVDNFIFSFLAWVVLAPNPVNFTTLIFTYVMGGYAARVIFAAISTPVIYLSYYCIPKKSK